MPKKGERLDDEGRARLAAIRNKKKAAPEDRATQRQRVLAWRAGKYPMSEWSDEEIRRGRVGSAAGEFYGNSPRMSAKEMKKLRTERLRRTMHTIQDTAPKAVGVIREVMAGGPWITGADQLRAANIVLDRSFGKAPERIIVTDEDPFTDIMDEVTEDRSGVEPKKRTRKKQ